MTLESGNKSNQSKIALHYLKDLSEIHRANRKSMFQTGSSGGECDQSVDIVDGTEVHKVCSSSSLTIKLGCANSTKKYLIRYSTNNLNVAVVFMVSLLGRFVFPLHHVLTQICFPFYLFLLNSNCLLVSL